MDEIFNNLYILIPVAVVIGLRILEARKKQGGNQPRQGLASRLQEIRGGGDSGEGTETEEDEGARGEDEFVPFGAPGSGSPHWSLREGEPSAPPPPPPPSPPKEPLSLEPPLPEIAAASAPAGAGQPFRKGGFPGTLDRLPPLKRAVAFTEILGPPKGLTG